MRISATHFYMNNTDNICANIIENHDHDGYRERINFYIYYQPDDDTCVGEVAGYIDNGLYYVDFVHVLAGHDLRPTMAAIVDYIARYFSYIATACPKNRPKIAAAIWVLIHSEQGGGIFIEDVGGPEEKQTDLGW